MPFGQRAPRPEREPLTGELVHSAEEIDAYGIVLTAESIVERAVTNYLPDQTGQALLLAPRGETAVIDSRWWGSAKQLARLIGRQHGYPAV